MAFDPITAIMTVGEKLIDHFFPDPKQKAEAYLELEKLKQSGDLAVIAAQSEINKIEAANPNTFVSGWRPAVGWVCASGLAIQFVVGPLVIWLMACFGHPLVLPVMNLELLTTLLIGMLGLGGMRTVEKLNGVASK